MILSQYDLDAPFPKLKDSEINVASRQQMMIEIAEKHQFSIRQLYQHIASARGHWTLIRSEQSLKS